MKGIITKGELMMTLDAMTDEGVEECECEVFPYSDGSGLCLWPTFCDQGLKPRKVKQLDLLENKP